MMDNDTQTPVKLIDIIDNVQVRNVITGVNGQDGRILRSILEGLGEEVFGISRAGTMATSNNYAIPARVDITNKDEFGQFLDLVKPKRIFHLAASHASSAEMSSHGEKNNKEMIEVHAEATRYLLEWQRKNITLQTHSVIALSSQLYSSESTLIEVNEESPIKPASKYGETKKMALEFIRSYRDNFAVISSGAILFNHSSIYSKPNFVLQNLAMQIAQSIMGKINVIKLRDFNAILDVSDANDICRGLNKMARMSEGSEYILSSGRGTNLRDLATKCLVHYRLEENTKLVSTQAEKFNQNVLIGNPEKARILLKWEPSVNQLDLLINLVENQLVRKS
jgi:GDPmannose 4,6-dehydratase